MVQRSQPWKTLARASVLRHKMAGEIQDILGGSRGFQENHERQDQLLERHRHILRQGDYMIWLLCEEMRQD